MGEGINQPLYDKWFFFAVSPEHTIGLSEGAEGSFLVNVPLAVCRAGRRTSARHTDRNVSGPAYLRTPLKEYLSHKSLPRVSCTVPSSSSLRQKTAGGGVFWCA